MRPVSRADLRQFALAAVLVVGCGARALPRRTAVLAFAVAAAAIAFLAHLVGGATEQLGGRVGSSAAGVVQSALGNLPELFIALFALHKGLVGVVQAALVGSVIANSVLVLGIAFLVGGIRNGTQQFDSPRARMIATLAMLAAAILSMPTLAHAFHAPAAPHGRTLEPDLRRRADRALLRDAAVVPERRGRTERASRRAGRCRLTVVVLGGAGVAAAFVSDWFVSALTPATHAMHMSQDFAGLVVVAIAGNAVENVVGVQLAARNRPDFAISVILNSALQVALLLTPVLVFASLFFATSLTLVFPTLLAIVAPARGGHRRARRLRRREHLGGRRDPHRPLRRDRGELLVGRLTEVTAFEFRIQTRWPDFDGLGHLNHAVYHVYLDEARDDALRRTSATSARGRTCSCTHRSTTGARSGSASTRS